MLIGYENLLSWGKPKREKDDAILNYTVLLSSDFAL